MEYFKYCDSCTVIPNLCQEDPNPGIAHVVISGEYTHWLGSVAKLVCTKGYSWAAAGDVALDTVCQSDGSWLFKSKDYCKCDRCTTIF